MKRIFILFTILLLSSAFAYDFNYDGRNLSYDPDKLKFYENSRLLSENEVHSIFNDYEIILVSKFNDKRKYVVKNSIFKTKKVLLLNDTDRTFHMFYIYPVESRYEDGNIKSLIKIHGKKNVRLKHEGGDEFEIVIH